MRGSQGRHGARHRLRSRWTVAALVLTTLGLAACGSTRQEVPRTTATTTTTTSTTASSTTAGTAASPSTTTTVAGAPVQLSVYFMRGDKLGAAHRTVPATPQVGTAAVRALLAGPTPQERAAGLASAIPAGTQLLHLSIGGRTATVDLSSEFASGGGSLSMSARLAQVVFTLTQFPTVAQVQFELNGKPVTVFGGEGIVLDHPVGRADYEDLVPAIFVESPAVGDTVVSPLRAWGTANVFEAVFHIQVADGAGTVLVDRSVTASSGTGTRGTFAVSVPFAAGRSGPGSVVVYALSPKDGSRIDVVQIPVQLSAG